MKSAQATAGAKARQTLKVIHIRIGSVGVMQKPYGYEKETEEEPERDDGDHSSIPLSLSATIRCLIASCDRITQPELPARFFTAAGRLRCASGGFCGLRTENVISPSTSL